MALYQVSAPPAEPVSVAELKRHTKVDGADEDMDLLVWIAAAREQVEQDANLQLVASTWRLTLDGFPIDLAIELPKCPLVGVSSITYVDGDGETQTLDADQYQVVGDVEGAYIWPAFNVSWPTVRDVAESVAVTFVAGWPVTTIAQAISVGARTVTPASMAGIAAGQALLIDGDRATAELVVVQSVTDSTFTASFANEHASTPIPVNGVRHRARQAIRLLAAHWYRNREAVDPNPGSAFALAYESLIQSLRVWKLE